MTDTSYDDMTKNYGNFSLEDLYVKKTVSNSKNKSRKQRERKIKPKKELTEFEKLENRKYEEIAKYIEAEHSQRLRTRNLSVLVATSSFNKKAEYLDDLMRSKLWLNMSTFLFLQGHTSNYYGAIANVNEGCYDIAIIIDLLEYSPSLISMANMIKLMSRSLRQDPKRKTPSSMIIFGRDMASMKKLALNDGYTLTSNGYTMISYAEGIYNEALIRGFQNPKELEEMMIISRCDQLPTTNNVKVLKSNIKEIDPHHFFVVGK